MNYAGVAADLNWPAHDLYSTPMKTQVSGSKPTRTIRMHSVRVSQKGFPTYNFRSAAQDSFSLWLSTFDRFTRGMKETDIPPVISVRPVSISVVSAPKETPVATLSV